MIKTGAHRVHPQDVEEVIAELPGVREVAVTGVDDAILGQVVAAFLVRDGDVPNETAVKAHCRQRLAGYKIPKQVAFVAELPRTASGKVRRAALTQRSEEHTSELQSLIRSSYAGFCLKKKTHIQRNK